MTSSPSAAVCYGAHWPVPHGLIYVYIYMCVYTYVYAYMYFDIPLQCLVSLRYMPRSEQEGLFPRKFFMHE